jgi:allophanate hydrolase
MTASSPLIRDIASMRDAYRAAATSVPAVVEALLAMLAARGDDPVWIERESDAALRARAAELAALDAGAVTALPLYGIPFAVKDNIDVAGRTTTAACRAFAHRADETARAVQRLLDAGAIYVGKTNLDQFATGLVGVRSQYGVPANTFNADYVPGGSSSGSAVAVAAGLVSFALGTDTAGSGRVPAAFNNIVGLKPTRGLISNHGLLPACRSLDCIAVFALGCADAQTVLNVVAGHDPADPWSRAQPASAPAADRYSAAFRFGVLAPAQREFFGDQQAAAGYARAIESLRALGGTAVEFDYAPFAETAALLYQGPWVAERYAAIRAFIEARPEALHPVTRQITESARNYSAVDAFEAQYRLQALRARCETAWRGAAAAQTGTASLDLDLLLLPTAATIYTRAAVEAEPVLLNTRLGYYTNFVNLLDLSAVAVPAGLREDGLPFGVTLLAPAFHDAALLALGSRLHAAGSRTTGAFGLPVPTAAPLAGAAPASPAGAIAIAVVGAHLSGMPLNHQLTSRGARLIEATHTAAQYRLFALAGTVPPKPGLARTDADGAAIEVEVWELDAAGFGAFTAEVPPPLAIGTVMLADGRRVKGFVCEAIGLSGAQDITRFGGWRAWLASAASSQGVHR